ncbi:LysE/ArgO family amino acid transporter [Nocardioides sp. S-58]|uniref:LysE/ArgO family amino acid transporter n=1 Tax=Nocardioides renjunii TaxID=3095075 RepID=A0ABU5K8K5_9ACTN|nr:MULTISPECIES: LysE/ArgO family amino acid transporter [unclassified Nocardioides]MDZ5661296.1 LysE/ArgO family amino acid transporter [Nocardioides sp. S-58]WQQ22299.1 LysE/ArgO family amino acid transporter [Nocardioides sp. S-34]
MGDLVAGLLTGLSLIVAIGAQNAFVLRQGLRRSHLGLVVAVCALSDVVLIVAGVAGIGVVVDRAPWAVEAIRWLGVAFLVVYGVGSLLRARRPQSLAAGDAVVERRAGVLARAVALTWLNPHVYLDTVLLLGSIAGTHGEPGRWWFALGACVASVLWFAGLGYGARLAAPRLADPRAWQVLDVVIGLVMLGIALRLALGA